MYLKSQWIVQFRIWQFNNIPALVAVLLRVAGVTADLAESNGSLPPGLWLTSPAGWLPRTWISSGTLCSVIEYGLPFYQLWQPQSMNSVSLYTIWSMSPALGRTTDLQRLCSVRNWRLSALLSAVGRLTASSPCVASGILLSRTTGVAAADKKTTTLTKFVTSIVCPSRHRQASGVRLAKQIVHSCKLQSERTARDRSPLSYRYSWAAADNNVMIRPKLHICIAFTSKCRQFCNRFYYLGCKTII